MASELNLIAVKTFVEYCQSLTEADWRLAWRGNGVYTIQEVLGLLYPETDILCLSVWQENVDGSGKDGPYCPDCVFGEWLGCTAGANAFHDIRMKLAGTPAKMQSYLDKRVKKLLVLSGVLAKRKKYPRKKYPRKKKVVTKETEDKCYDKC